MDPIRVVSSEKYTQEEYCSMEVDVFDLLALKFGEYNYYNPLPPNKLDNNQLAKTLGYIVGGTEIDLDKAESFYEHLFKVNQWIIIS